jgi:hypothetical protein
MRQWLSIAAGAAVLVLFALPEVAWGHVVSSLLVSGVLALALARSTASGPGLIASLSGLLFVFSWLINIPEGVLFDVIPPTTAPVALFWSLIGSVAAVTVMVAVTGRLEATSEPTPSRGPIDTTRGLFWRLGASAAVFVGCYFVAGIIIFPFVEPFYQDLAMPDPGTIVAMQVLRSLAMVGAAYPVLRTLRNRRDAVLVMALALPVFGSLAPLIPANDAMPGAVRLVHALETVPYYALFGALVAVWFGPARPSRVTEPEAAVGEPVVAG